MTARVLSRAEVPAQRPLGRLPWPMLPSFFLMLPTEFRRAVAAERRYRDMKHGLAPTADISRRVYEEFYAQESTATNRARRATERLTGIKSQGILSYLRFRRPHHEAARGEGGGHILLPLLPKPVKPGSAVRRRALRYWLARPESGGSW